MGNMNFHNKYSTLLVSYAWNILNNFANGHISKISEADLWIAWSETIQSFKIRTRCVLVAFPFLDNFPGFTMLLRLPASAARFLGFLWRQNPRLCFFVCSCFPSFLPFPLLPFCSLFCTEACKFCTVWCSFWWVKCREAILYRNCNNPAELGVISALPMWHPCRKDVVQCRNCNNPVKNYPWWQKGHKIYKQSYEISHKILGWGVWCDKYLF